VGQAELSRDPRDDILDDDDSAEGAYGRLGTEQHGANAGGRLSIRLPQLQTKDR
jgi:hypothetical protein